MALIVNLTNQTAALFIGLPAAPVLLELIAD